MTDLIPLLGLKTLCELGVTSLHALKSLNLSRMRFHGVIVDSFSSFSADTSAVFPNDLPGMTLTKGETRIILYRDGMSFGRRNFTIAHELGHLLLGHTVSDSAVEREADLFAESLLIPSALVLLIEKKTGKRLLPVDMLRYFPVSLSVCKIKRREMDSSSFPFPNESELRIADPFLSDMFADISFVSTEEAWLDPDKI